MRVISGTYRGLRLKTLKGGSLRPTSDRMRETLFDVLGDRIRDARFLDAYAGSGAVGIEALSRGAAHVVFLEQHRQAAEIIRQNLRSLGLTSGFRVIATDAGQGIERLAVEAARFDIAFLDPPYAEIGEYHRILRVLSRAKVLRGDSLVMAEHSRRTRLETQYQSLSLGRVFQHGDTCLALYHVSADK
jgi:16S rRNA (guanine966-N2)-methyltransferase